MKADHSESEKETYTDNKIKSQKSGMINDKLMKNAYNYLV